MIASATLRIGRVDPPGGETVHPAALRRGAAELLPDADYVVVHPGPESIRQLLVHLHSLDPAIQIILVPDDDRRAEVERAILFTPGVGEIWMATPSELDEALFTRAAEVTRRRRAYPTTRSQVERGLRRLGAASTERRMISDAFLAALLRVLPDPVLSLDDDGVVISANPSAGRLLDRSAERLEGLHLADTLNAEDREELDATLELGRERPAEGEITFRPDDEAPRVAEITVVPVRAERYRVRCVVLHDITEHRRARGELERQAWLLQEQAAERERVNRELIDRTEELERVMDLRSRFYAGMSHELRTPLNAIIGYQSLLLDGLLGELPENHAAPLQKAQSAASHLLDLVQDVLDLSRIESGHIRLALEPVRLPRLLHDLADTVEPLAEERGATLTIEGPDEGPEILSDPRRLRQVLLNLLSNAVKFGEGKPVRVVWAPLEDGGAVVSVIDQGPGIPAERIEQVFEEFVQLGGPDDQLGSGLGLTISRRLTEAIGGRLEVESEVGRGSTFRVMLPPQPEPMDEAAETG